MSEQQSSLFNLEMSEEAQPLMDAVKKHIRDNVDPITKEFFDLKENREDRWSWHPRQLELLDGAKAKAAGLCLKNSSAIGKRTVWTLSTAPVKNNQRLI
jgi:hypothetical protein